MFRKVLAEVSETIKNPFEAAHIYAYGIKKYSMLRTSATLCVKLKLNCSSGLANTRKNGFEEIKK